MAVIFVHIALSIHDLTRRSTSVMKKTTQTMIPFNSRPHEEVDGCNMELTYKTKTFNSRPHEEVDMFR